MTEKMLKFVNVDKKKEGYFVNEFGDLPINKIPHLNDSLKFYEHLIVEF